MNIPAEFDDIRPYTPEELPQIFEELLSDKDFQAVIQSVMPNVPLEMIAAQLRHCKTNLDVQKAFFHKLLHDIMQQHSDGFDMDASSGHCTRSGLSLCRLAGQRLPYDRRNRYWR